MFKVTVLGHSLGHCIISATPVTTNLKIGLLTEVNRHNNMIFKFKTENVAGRHLLLFAMAIIVGLLIYISIINTVWSRTWKSCKDKIIFMIYRETNGFQNCRKRVLIVVFSLSVYGAQGMYGEQKNWFKYEDIKDDQNLWSLWMIMPLFTF